MNESELILGEADYCYMQKENECSRQVPHVGLDLVNTVLNVEDKTDVHIWAGHISGYDVVAKEIEGSWHWAVYIRSRKKLTPEQQEDLREKIGLDIEVGFRTSDYRGMHGEY